MHNRIKSLMYIDLRCADEVIYDRMIKFIEELQATESNLDIDMDYDKLKSKNRKIINITEKQEDGD